VTVDEENTDTLELEEDVDPIIEMLVKERLIRGWTQLDVGRKLGHTSGQVVSQWETGRVPSIGLRSLRAWAAVFDIEIVARSLIRRGRPRTNFKR
jgi:transcriptional regulator with XRE-family HTH domain